MDEAERKELGIEIRSMRKGQHLRQEDLAARAHVGVRTIRNLEAGKNVSPGTLGQVVTALGYKPQEPQWSEQVQAYLDMIGYRLSRLDDEARNALMDEITRAVVSAR